MAWVDAMTQQTLHEIDCQPCRHYRLPACDEGRRLQQEARAAHERWAADRAYATEEA
jgi:hypothetical protein